MHPGVVDTERQDRQSRPARPERLDQLDAAAAGHGHVAHHDIRQFLLLQRRQQSIAARHGADHPHVALFGDDLPQAVPYDGMVVGDEDSYGHHLPHSR